MKLIPRPRPGSNFRAASSTQLDNPSPCFHRLGLTLGELDKELPQHGVEGCSPVGSNAPSFAEEGFVKGDGDVFH
jgi:hypothetical protein